MVTFFKIKTVSEIVETPCQKGGPAAEAVET